MEQLQNLANDVISDPLKGTCVGLSWLQMDDYSSEFSFPGRKGGTGGCDVPEVKRNQEERECRSHLFLLWDF